DWGHARDFVRMQWLMLQQDEPEDFVIATGEQHSVREFCELAFAELGIGLKWEGEGIEEVGIVENAGILECWNAGMGRQEPGNRKAAVEIGQVLVRIDPRYFRPTEVDSLLGDPSKARQKLGWTPEISFQDMVREMVQYDYNLAQRDKLCNDHGYEVCSFHE
ncbi:MAG: GDP-mannose 4,6-dehydratase, partial [Thermodesulfobacteriota bacterium]